MKKLKYTLIFLIFLIVTTNSFSQTRNKYLFLAVDGFAPELKIGFENNFTTRFSWRASGGFCLVAPTIISYNFFYTYKITNPEKALGLKINFGFLDNYVCFKPHFYSLGLGTGLGVYYKFKNNHVFTFRLGLIMGPAYEENKAFRNLIIPNFGIEYALPLNKKKELQ